LGNDRQRPERKLHRTNSSVIDVDSIDLVNLDNPDGNGEGPFPDDHIQPVPSLLIQSFRVVYAFDLHARWKNNRGGDDRPRERPDPDFIDTGDVLNPGLPEQPLEMQHRVEPVAFPL